MATIQEAKYALSMANAIQQECDEILQEKCPLTPREKEVLSLVAQGLDYKQIAGRLGVSGQTVRNQQWTARMRLKALNSTHAVVIALQHGWIAFPQKGGKRDD